MGKSTGVGMRRLRACAAVAALIATCATFVHAADMTALHGSSLRLATGVWEGRSASLARSVGEVRLMLRGGGPKKGGEVEGLQELVEEEVEEERPPLDWKNQDPNEYEPVPLPAHCHWMKQVEEYLNEHFENDESQKNSFREHNLNCMLFWNENTTMAQKLCVYATMKMKVRGNYTAAESIFKKALEEDPKYVPALCNYANLLFVRLEKHDEAEEMYKKAIDADSNHATSHSNYGLFLHHVRNDFVGAEEHFKKALEIDKKHEVVGWNFAQLLMFYTTHKHNTTWLADVERNESETYGRARVLIRRARKNDPTRKDMPKFRHGLLKQRHSDGAECLYSCRFYCKHNIQNEAFKTRTCIKSTWADDRAKFTPPPAFLPPSLQPRPWFDPEFLKQINAAQEECPGIPISQDYYYGGKRPERPLRYRGSSMMPPGI